MSGWEVGDLALCVVDGVAINEHGTAVDATGLLKKGRVYLVIGIARYDSLFVEGATAIYQRNGVGFNRKRFIKVTPPEADEFDRETIDLYRGTPVTQEQRDAEFFAKIDSKVRRQMQGDD